MRGFELTVSLFFNDVSKIPACAFPRNYSPVCREGGGTRTVVRGKGEGGRGGAARDGHQENSDEGGGRQKPSGIASLAEMRKPFTRRRASRTSHTIWESNPEPRH